MLGWNHLSAYIVSILLACLEAVRSQSYHSFNGYGNNIKNPNWGIAGGELIRDPVPQAYSDGISNFTESRSGKELPGARTISLKFVGKDRESVARSERGTTDFVTYLGQFFDHDFDLNEHSWFEYGVGGEDAPIPIPECDPWYDPACEGDKTMGFTRTGYNGSTPVDKPRQQINGITSFLDGSVVYGSSFEWASKLRAYRNGKLLTSDGNLLPWNNMGLSMANDVNREDMMYAAGDKRANVNPAVIALQTLFMRNHNRLAEMYASENPGWSDEDLFYAARKWNIAQMQAICWYEYLPSLGIVVDAYDGYKENVNPSIDNFFSTVSYRYGHSEVANVLLRVDDYGNEIPEGHLLMFDTFFSPTRAMTAGIDPILRGLATMSNMEVDLRYESSIQHFLFNLEGHGGSDLLSRNIQRGRDHGIPLYNECRQAFGLSRKRAFEEVSTNSATVQALKEVYGGDVDLCDAYVCGLAEDHVYTSNLGELFYTSMKDQYTRTRDGDRFYFENTETNGARFTTEEISTLKSTHLRDLILLNTDVQRLPANLYIMDSGGDQWATSPENPPPPPVEAEEDAAPINIVTLHASNEYTLSWEPAAVEGGEDGEMEVHISLRARASGWLGFGLEGSGGMTDADIVMGYIDDAGRVQVKDYFGVGPGVAPVLDTELGGSNDVYNVAGEYKDGFTTINYTRPFVASDGNDQPINSEGVTAVIYAFQSDNSDDTTVYHGSSARGRGIAVDFNTKAGGDAPPAIDISGVEFQTHELEADYTVEYGLLGDDEMVIRMTYKSSGWIGLGMDPSDGGMTGADVYIGRFDGDSPIIEDRISAGYFAPDLDEVQDCTLVEGSREGDITSFTFIRKLDTGDSNDAVIEDRVMPMIYATGASDDFAYHAMRAKFDLNLLGGVGGEEVDYTEVEGDGHSDVANVTRSPSVDSKSTEVIDAHAAIMGIAWPLLCVIGVFIARFGRSLNHWLAMHRTMQTSVMLLSFIGQVMAFSYTKGDIVSSHGVTAIVVICISYPQLVLGLFAQQKGSSLRGLHRLTGYLLTGICLWQSYLGMELYGVTDRYLQLYYAWLIAVAVSTVFSGEAITKTDIVKIVSSSVAAARPPTSPQSEGKEDAKKEDEEALLAKTKKEKPPSEHKGKKKDVTEGKTPIKKQLPLPASESLALPAPEEPANTVDGQDGGASYTELPAAKMLPLHDLIRAHPEQGQAPAQLELPVAPAQLELPVKGSQAPSSILEHEANGRYDAGHDQPVNHQQPVYHQQPIHNGGNASGGFLSTLSGGAAGYNYGSQQNAEQAGGISLPRGVQSMEANGGNPAYMDGPFSNPLTHAHANPLAAYSYGTRPPPQGHYLQGQSQRSNDAYGAPPYGHGNATPGSAPGSVKSDASSISKAGKPISPNSKLFMYAS